MQVRAISQEQFVDLAETANVVECLDLGVVSILKLVREGNEELLLSTTAETYAQVQER